MEKCSEDKALETRQNQDGDLWCQNGHGRTNW